MFAILSYTLNPTRKGLLSLQAIFLSFVYKYLISFIKAKSGIFREKAGSLIRQKWQRKLFLKERQPQWRLTKHLEATREFYLLN